MEEINIKEISKLARIKLSEEEEEKFKKDLEVVKKMFDEIDEIDANEEPSYHPIKIKNRYREDKKIEREKIDIFSNTIHKENNYFKGPRV
ncbi:MAG: Asp-tRNA(Asn)/Glu-tRNA(Gln) amidotransferase GatCAB subunit C [Candidatus Aenigmarchaeota archaeon ex4484_56]|nr:MAG: Asp-tRNA(Asn)/Glu-tRNA(Gln) amidotransferase GatCAB subunit C [Candidatus Aenigmarchaeota archaeon ex4484_56]